MQWIFILTLNKVLVQATRNVKATRALVKRSSVLCWIQIQLRHPKTDELDLWIEVLGNVSRVLDPVKTDQVTLGGWRYTIAECLSLILQVPSRLRHSSTLRLTPHW